MIYLLWKANFYQLEILLYHILSGQRWHLVNGTLLFHWIIQLVILTVLYLWGALKAKP